MKGPSLIPTLDKFTMLFAISPFLLSPRKSKESLRAGSPVEVGVDTLETEVGAYASGVTAGVFEELVTDTEEA